MEYIEPWEQALLFLYLAQKGMPPDKTQEETLARLMNWSESKTIDALAEVARRGMADKP